MRVTLPIQEETLSRADALRLYLKHISWLMEIRYVPDTIPGNAGTFIPSEVERFMSKKMDGDTRFDLVKELKERAEQAANARKTAEQEEQAHRVDMVKGRAKGVANIRNAAEQGDANAQRELGCCYENGEGVPKNMAEAVKWYRKAAEQGDSQAQFCLGFCYDSGNGVSKDIGEAVKWYRKAADQGNASAQCALQQIQMSWGQRFY